MPDLSHLWQRFLLALTLLLGLAVGVAATVFGYSNTQTVDVRFSVLELNAVPLWAVGLVPVALVIAAGTLYHWWNSLHQFTEHMRHRHRVRELEAEVASLKSHLDKFLEMPGGTSTEKAAPAVGEPVTSPVTGPSETEVIAATDEPAAEAKPVNGSRKKDKKSSKTDSAESISLSGGFDATSPLHDATSPVPGEEETEDVAAPVAPTAGS